MQKFNTKGIVLARTNYGEAARIITFLTPDHGKVKAMAKGVRKSKSKLAGGIELFSVSDIGVMVGRGEVDTLVSSRLAKHYLNIVKDLARTDLGYKLIKRLNKATEEATEPDYFYLLENAFTALDDSKLDLNLIELWFDMQLLRLMGHTPNLRTDEQGAKLQPGQKYGFDYDKMCFSPNARGKFTADHIKFLRLGFSQNTAQILSRVKTWAGLTADSQPLVQSMLQTYIRT